MLLKSLKVTGVNIVVVTKEAVNVAVHKLYVQMHIHNDCDKRPKNKKQADMQQVKRRSELAVQQSILLTMHTKAWTMGNREIGKPNTVPCHLPSLPPSVSQQMLCSMKTLSAAQEWDEICRQWRRGPEDKTRDKKKTQNNVLKVSMRVNNDDTAPGRSAACKWMHRALSRNRTYRYGNLALPLLTTITIGYTDTHTLVSCSLGTLCAQMVANCITHLSVSGL